MKTIKLVTHSIVDVITNSSTVIFTYSSGSVEPAKELINEFAKFSGMSEKADDMFWFGVFCDDEDYLSYSNTPKEISSANEGTWEEREQRLRELQKSIMQGKIEQPAWMESAKKECWDDYGPSVSNYLHILPKDEKYEELAEKLSKFLYSTSADGVYNG